MAIINIMVEKSSAITKIKYVIDFLNNHPRKPKEVQVTMNAEEANHHLLYDEGGHIPRQNLIFSDALVESSTLCANIYMQSERVVYSVEKSKKEPSPFYIKPHFGFDIIETIFFHLSRYEEFHYPESMQNEWGMMPEKLQFLVRNGLNELPVVDNILKAFFSSLDFVIGDTPSQIILTHDIDHLEKYNNFGNLTKSVASVFRRNFLSVPSLLKEAFGVYRNDNEEPYMQFIKLFDLLPDRKIMFFIVGGQHLYDPEISQDRFEKMEMLMKLAIDSQYEIGMHASYLTATDGSLMRREMLKLEELFALPLTICRQHYLHFSFLETITLMEKIGIKEDSSIGYNEHIGFRAGTGHTFYLYNWKEERPSNIKELPLAWMDSAQWIYSGKNKNAYLEKATSFFNNNKDNTVLNINIHNSAYYDHQKYGVNLKKLITLIFNNRYCSKDD